MQNTSKAIAEFNQRLHELQKSIEPALEENNLKEILIYGKLLEMQDQINKMNDKLEKNK